MKKYRLEQCPGCQILTTQPLIKKARAPDGETIRRCPRCLTLFRRLGRLPETHLPAVQLTRVENLSCPTDKSF